MKKKVLLLVTVLLVLGALLIFAIVPEDNPAQSLGPAGLVLAGLSGWITKKTAAVKKAIQGALGIVVGTSQQWAPAEHDATAIDVWVEGEPVKVALPEGIRPSEILAVKVTQEAATIQVRHVATDRRAMLGAKP
jgi:di/tricarboxylate transporter